MSTTMQPSPIVTRGDFLRAMGAVRLDDGTFKLPAPCHECGASRMAIHWAAAKGLDGVMTHVPDSPGVAGCTMTTIGNSPPVAVQGPAPSPEVITPTPVAVNAPVSDPGVNYVRFKDPVGGDRVSPDLQSWSRTKEGLRIGLHVEPPYVVLSWPGEIRRVPLSNVAYIAERVTS